MTANTNIKINVSHGKIAINSAMYEQLKSAMNFYDITVEEILYDALSQHLKHTDRELKAFKQTSLEGFISRKEANARFDEIEAKCKSMRSKQQSDEEALWDEKANALKQQNKSN
jgi:hypothetical protein